MGGPVETPGRFWVLFLLPPAGYFLSFPFLFASGGLLLSVATKVTKSAIQGGRKFRSSFPLENPLSLSDQRGRAAALPLWKHPPLGWAIIKSRLCRKAAKVGGGLWPLFWKVFLLSIGGCRGARALPARAYDAYAAGDFVGADAHIRPHGWRRGYRQTCVGAGLCPAWK